jgi:integrase
MSKGGSISQKKNGKWKWTGYFIDLSGKEHRPNRTFDTKKEAEDYKRQQLKEGTTLNNYKNRTDYTVAEFFEVWFSTYCNDEKTYSYNTSARWLSTYNSHILPVIGNCKIDNIDFKRFQRHLSKLDVTRKTKKNIASALKSMLTIAYKRRIIDKGFDDEIDRLDYTGNPSQRGNIFNVMEEETFQKLIEFMYEQKYYYAAPLEFLHETGLRSEEISFTDNEVTIKQDGLSGELQVRLAIKRKKERDGSSEAVESKILKTEYAHRTVPLTYTALLCMEKQKAAKRALHIKSKYIFCSQAGTPINRDNFRNRFLSAIDIYNKQYPDAPIEKTFGLHAMRKLFCKSIYEATGDIYMAQHALGHSNVSVTQDYYKGYDHSEIEKAQEKLNERDKNLMRLKQEQERTEKEEADYYLWLDNISSADGEAAMEWLNKHPHVRARLKAEGILV